MVELGSAGGTVQDTRGVLLEYGLVSLDGDGGWSSLDGGHEGRGGVGGDLLETSAVELSSVLA